MCKQDEWGMVSWTMKPSFQGFEVEQDNQIIFEGGLWWFHSHAVGWWENLKVVFWALDALLERQDIYKWGDVGVTNDKKWKP